MPKRSDVGRSDRTPAKHELLKRSVSRVFNAATTARIGANRRVGIDLTAGDGIPTEDTDFWLGTSPGILIRYAASTAQRPIHPSIVILYEINPNTFNRLIDSLTTHIGPAVATAQGKARFEYRLPLKETTPVIILAFCESGKTADISFIGRGDCVFVCNDPNSIHDWAMRPEFIAEILAKTWLCTTFSTMGCNTGGLMMKPYEERKTMWYPHLQTIKLYLSEYTDLVLAAVNRDASKWAYVITVPTARSRTDWRAETEKDITRAFTKIGRTMKIVWWRLDQLGFAALEDQLFLTRAENDARRDGLFGIGDLT